MVFPMTAVNLILAMQPSAPTCRTADRRVETVIQAKARELQGIEYCQFRRYYTLSDVDGDRKDDLLVVFSIESIQGSNHTVQFLAAFGSRTGWRPSVLKVGERGVRVVLNIDVRGDNTIILETLEQRDGDALCCPSGHGRLAFRVKSGAIVPADAPR